MLKSRWFLFFVDTVVSGDTMYNKSVARKILVLRQDRVLHEG